MDDQFEKTAEQAAAFQKMWLEAVSKMMQSAFTFSPNSPPPEVLRQIRSGIFQALGETWEEFMRSPQFLEGMRQWMDSAVTFRQMTNDFLANVRSEMQGTSRGDIDTVMLAIRHMEKRVLDRVEELSAEVEELKKRAGNGRAGGRAADGPKGRAGRAGNAKQSRGRKAKARAV